MKNGFIFAMNFQKCPSLRHLCKVINWCIFAAGFSAYVNTCVYLSVFLSSIVKCSGREIECVFKYNMVVVSENSGGISSYRDVMLCQTLFGFSYSQRLDPQENYIFRVDAPICANLQPPI